MKDYLLFFIKYVNMPQIFARFAAQPSDFYFYLNLT